MAVNSRCSTGASGGAPPLDPEDAWSAVMLVSVLNVSDSSFVLVASIVSVSVKTPIVVSPVLGGGTLVVVGVSVGVAVVDSASVVVPVVCSTGSSPKVVQSHAPMDDEATSAPAIARGVLFGLDTCVSFLV